MKRRDSGRNEDPRKEYDFSGGVRGKYARRYAQGSNVVVLAPDVAEVFRTSADVNRALRSHLGGEAARGPRRPRRRRRRRKSPR